MTSTLSSSHGSINQSSLKSFSRLHTLESAPNERPSLHLVIPEGQLQVHTATYRGSFSVVLSQALRSAGLGSKVLIAQLLKGGVDQGTENAVNLCGSLQWYRPAIPCYLTRPVEESIKDPNLKNAIEAVSSLWKLCKEFILHNDLDQVVLDEVGLAVALGFIKEEDLITTLDKRPKRMDVILTGPYIPSRIIEMADQVTELRCGN